MNNALMHAIFSMDAYNRGYDAGIEIYPENETDNKFIGTAKIIKNSSVVFNDADKDISFYALAYPKLVTFTDLNDPKSVTLAQVWERNRKDGLFYLKEDRMEKLFGEGVKLKSIVIETTDEPKTKTNILETLPKFDDEFWEWRKKLEYSDPRKISGTNFSKGTDK